MHSCALLNSGSVRCWGDNGFGQLGNGTTRDASVPLAVAGITNAVAIDSASTSLSTCAVLATGGVRCWGRNHHGQLGNGTTTDSTTPVAVSNITGATSIAAGQDHTCVALSNGEARCWGWNNRGQLGNGTTTDTLVPATVTGLTGAAAVSAGGGHTCAALTDQSVRCWGSNAWGALGNGSSATDSKVPVMVSGISTATAISSGRAHLCHPHLRWGPMLGPEHRRTTRRRHHHRLDDTGGRLQYHQRHQRQRRLPTFVRQTRGRWCKLLGLQLRRAARRRDHHRFDNTCNRQQP